MIKVIIAQIPEGGLAFNGDCLDDIFTDIIDSRTKDVSPLMYELNLSLVRGDLVVQGASTVVIDAICDRCLVEYEHVINIDNLCHVIEKVDDVVDLTEYLREDIILAIPQTYLCSDDCDCGHPVHDESDYNDIEPCNNAENAEESPWSELGDIKF